MNLLIYSWPWNQQTIMSWIVDEMISFPAGSAYLLVNGAFISFFITICEYHRAFYKYLCEIIADCDNLVVSKAGGRHDLKFLLRKFIRFHISAKE